MRRRVRSAHPPVVGLDARFWAKVAKKGPDECWLWTASRDSNGYGRFRVGGRGTSPASAHVVSYEMHHGPVPPGLEVDHLCRTRTCVNPRHLEAVTHAENCRRGTAAEVNRERQLAVTHCPQGHPYDERNTGRRADGRRRCRACDRDYQRARRAARSAT